MISRPMKAAAALSVTGVLGATWGIGSGAIGRSSDAATADQPSASAPAADDQKPRTPDRFIVTIDTSDKVPTDQRRDGYDREAKAQDVQVKSTRSMGLGAEVVQLNKPLDHGDASAFISSLNKQKGVARVEVDQFMRPTSAPNDPDYGQQWDMADSATGINLGKARDTSTGKGATVGVVDTGITAHPDLDANVSGGYDFISDGAKARDNDGRDGNPADEGDYPDASCGGGNGDDTSSWHGTHVSGTVAAVTNNGTGVAGVAGDAKVEPLRALGACGGYSSDIIDAMLWGAGESVPGLPANPNPVQVLNLSLGGSGQCSTTYQNAIDKVRAKGVTVVVAAGNENADVSGSTPANCNGAVAVAASDKAGAKASYSDFGAGVDVTAPGSDIHSTINKGSTSVGEPGYSDLSGTSMAAPHVAGVVALMKSANPALTPDEVEQKLKSTARPLPGGCSQGCGAGLVDAAAALN